MLRFRSIDQTLEKIKTIAGFIDTKEVYALILIVLAGFGGYFTGLLAHYQKDRVPVTIERLNLAYTASSQDISTSTAKVASPAVSSSTAPIKALKTGLYVGSKSGSKYHLPNCPGAKQISEKNKIWFASKQEAEGLGYSPAGNCKGI